MLLNTLLHILQITGVIQTHAEGIVQGYVTVADKTKYNTVASSVAELTTAPDAKITNNCLILVLKDDNINSKKKKKSIINPLRGAAADSALQRVVKQRWEVA